MFFPAIALSAAPSQNLHEKSPFDPLSKKLQSKNPRQTHLSRTNHPIRGATLFHGLTRALCGIPLYPRQLTYAPTSQNTLEPPPHLTAPSAVHLTTCFSPDSQRRGLSVQASLPLSPHQRFAMNFLPSYHFAPALSRPLPKNWNGAAFCCPDNIIFQFLALY